VKNIQNDAELLPLDGQHLRHYAMTPAQFFLAMIALIYQFWGKVSGVHLGQSDMTPQDARRLAGRKLAHWTFDTFG